MERVSSRRVVAYCTVAGATLGFVALHPYTMLVYGYHEGHSGAAMPTGDGMFMAALHAFAPDMLHMGLPFALLGAVAGLFFGFWLVARRQQEESEKRACAVDTLKQLMVTLSHYLLNASTVIGGYAVHSLKAEKDDGIKAHLNVIKEEADCIEAVVKSLQSLDFVVTEHYTKDSETMIIDIQKQLDERLKASVGRAGARSGQKAA